MGTSRETVSEIDLNVLLNGLLAIHEGNFGVRLPSNWDGIGGKIADSLNAVIGLNRRLAGELDRLKKTVGEEGKLSKRFEFEGAIGSWAGMKDSLNGLIEDF